MGIKWGFNDDLMVLDGKVLEHEFENIVDVFQIQHHVNDVMCGTD